MISAFLLVYLIGVALSTLLIGKIYYNNRKNEYVVTRVDFPVGLSARAKYGYIKEFMQKKKIRNVRGIYLFESKSIMTDTLDQATSVYLDYAS